MTRNFDTMTETEAHEAGYAQVHNGRFGCLTGVHGPNALPYLYSMQAQLADWSERIAREIALFEGMRAADEASHEDR